VFTGLVDDIGTIERAAAGPAGRELRLRTRYQDLVPGESIALNGACLTVRECGPGWFSCASVVTTLGRTTIGSWRAGTRVNLERALAVGDRLGGHLVQGHVDGVARVTAVRDLGDALLIDLALPEMVSELTVPHGSITVDGVSLTVNEMLPAGVQLSVIEVTRGRTTLGGLAVGDEVHVEADLIGKYVQRLVAPYAAGAAAAPRS
jgi:riboflavin synthase